MAKTSDRKVPYDKASWAVSEFSRVPYPLAGQFYLYFTLVLLVFLGGFSFISEVPLTVQSFGAVTSTEPPVPIRAATQFTITQLLIKENQEVKEGQLLVSSSENISKKDLANLKKYSAGIKPFIGHIKKKCIKCLKTNEIRGVSKSYLAIKAQGDILDVISPVQVKLQELISAKESYDEIPSLTKDSRIQIKVNERKLKKIRARRATRVLAKTVETLKRDSEVHKRKITEKYQEGWQRISDVSYALESSLSDLNNRIKYLGSVLTIKAPFSGVVTNVKVKGQGELVQRGQLLMELVPRNTRMMAQLKVLNRDISQIQTGQNVIVSVDAYPELEYGTIEGTVSSIARYEDASNINDINLESIFLVNVNLNSQFIEKDGNKNPLLMGMTVKGRIVIKIESVLAALGRILFRIKDSKGPVYGTTQ